MRSFLLVLLGGIAVSLPLSAQGPRSVYGPSTPGDSAFVRVISLLPDPVRISLGATRIGPVAPRTVSDYRPVVPDIYLVRAGGQALEVVPKSGTWITLACTPKGIIAFEDPPHTDPARAQLFLYNLSSIASVDLKSADGKTTVLAGVKSGSSAQVVVNAVTVSFALFDRGALVKPIGALRLERGSSFSVFALDEGRGVTVLTVKAAVKVD